MISLSTTTTTTISYKKLLSPNWRLQLLNGQKNGQNNFFSNSDDGFILIGVRLIYMWNIVAKLAKLEKKNFFLNCGRKNFFSERKNFFSRRKNFFLPEKIFFLRKIFFLSEKISTSKIFPEVMSCNTLPDPRHTPTSRDSPNSRNFPARAARAARAARGPRGKFPGPPGDPPRTPPVTHE